MGEVVSDAGDVNGDGYFDVLVAATSFDAGQANEERAFLHLGSAADLATSAAWSVDHDQGNGDHGAWELSIAGACDVNGDV